MQSKLKLIVAAAATLCGSAAMARACGASSSKGTDAVSISKRTTPKL